jgi:FtsH-binding integral membrane protein
MIDNMSSYYGSQIAAQAPLTARLAFIRKTYSHLAVAVFAFVFLEAFLFSAGIGEAAFKAIVSQKVSMIALVLLFIGSGYVAQMMAASRSKATQYLGLALYVVVETIFFLPIIYFAETKFPGRHLPLQAGLLTLGVFGGLTAAVFISKKDFSFLGHALSILGLLALGLILVSVFGGLNLGVWFSVAMIALVSLTILYTTSNVMLHFGTDQYVGAALELFASLTTLFYYILRLLLATTSDD